MNAERQPNVGVNSREREQIFGLVEPDCGNQKPPYPCFASFVERPFPLLLG